MKSQARSDCKELISEIGRYLAVVDAFRAAGYEPTWRPELVPGGAMPPAPHARSGDQIPSDVGLH
jgi:hypothetical protein